MIEKLGRRSSSAPMGAGVKICRIDFDIWDEVLGRQPGMRLEAMSRADDRRDSDIMFARVDAKHDADSKPPAD